MRSENDTKTKQLTRTQQARRSDIIAAAITVINRDGYAAASVQKIAEESATSKSTVLYHFKSKAEIERAIVATVFEDGAAYMGPFIVQAQGYSEKLHAYLTSNLQFIADNAPSIAALLEIERNIGHKEFADVSSHTQEDLPTRWLQEALKEGQQAGEFGTFDPAMLAVSIRLIIDGSAHYMVTHPSLDSTHYIAETIRLFDAITTKQETNYPTDIDSG